jgi:methionyl-tRNA synthetase
MKITKKELKELINEEASKYVRTELLKERKEKIQKAINKINEGEDITEEEMNELFGSVGAGLKSVGKMIGGKAKDVAGKVSDATKAATEKAGEAVKSAAGEVKQAYQSGVDKAKYEKAKKEIYQIAKEIALLRGKSKESEAKLQDRYSKLTGGKPFKSAVHNPVMAEGKVIWVEKELLDENTVFTEGTDYTANLGRADNEKVDKLMSVLPEEAKNAIRQVADKVTEALRGVEGIMEIDPTIRDTSVLIGSIAYDKLDE